MPIVTASSPASCPDIAAPVGGRGGNLPRLSVPANLRLVNYYPIRAAQARMFTDGWEPQYLAADFAKLALLGANAVRIAVWPTPLGYPTVNSYHLDRLRQIIDLASDAGLYTYLSLFAGFSGYTDFTGSKGWARQILTPFYGDARICAVELQNELDTTNASAKTWAQSLIPYLRTIATAPLTISVSNTQSSGGLTTLVGLNLGLDFYNLHYYNAPERANTQLAAAKSAVAPAALCIGESGNWTGLDAHTSDARGQVWWEQYQSFTHRMAQQAAALNSLPAPAVWAANDLSESNPDAYVPHNATLANYSYGLWRTDGSRKPAGDTLAALWAHAGASDHSFNGDFELYDAPSGLPALWNVQQIGTGTAAVDATVSHGGTYSVKLSATPNANSPGWFLAAAPQFITPGVSYTMTAWVNRLSVTGTNRIQISWFSGTGGFLSTSAGTTLSIGTAGWTQTTLVATAPASAAYCQLTLLSLNNTGTVWFDDVTFGPT